MDLVYFPGLDLVCIYIIAFLSIKWKMEFTGCVCDLQLPFHGRPGSLW